MLEHLHIRNVALIKESEISFGDGLNILTGETGAGKSMIIDSLQFALGGRAGKDFLRHGEKQAAVEALFSVQSQALTEKLAENGIVPEEDGTLLITRTLSEAGKSVCRINGSTVTVGMLKEIAEDMIDIYGQHEHQSLLNPVKHIRLLDRFCGAGFGEAMEEYKNSRQSLKDLEKQLTILMGDEYAAVSEGRNRSGRAAGGRGGCPSGAEKTPEQHGKADTTDGRKCNTSV